MERLHKIVRSGKVHDALDCMEICFSRLNAAIVAVGVIGVGSGEWVGTTHICTRVHHMHFPHAD